MTTSMRPRASRRRPSTLAGGVALALGLVAGGCQELTLTNPNNPDRARALEQPASVEALAASSFRAWWPNAHDEAPVWALSTMADEFTAAFFDFGILTASSEPRVAYDNSQTYADRFVNQDPWYSLYASLSQANDVLVALDSGLTITNGTQNDTPRARAVAKLVQGLSHGYLALYFDRAWIITERTRTDTLTVPGTTRLRGEPAGYRAVMDTALSELAEAARIAQGANFTLPEGSWLFQSLSAADLARLARSYAARLRAQVARTRDERQAVAWTQVIADVDAGMTRDFAPIAVPGVFFNDFTRVAARTRVPTQPGDFARVDYMTVGPADSTGRFVAWVRTPVSARTRFQLVTRDRRIHPAGNPGADGKYFGYTTSQRFQDARGTYHQSNYWYRRQGTGNTWENGPQLALTVDELQLLKAEGLLRLGRAAEAVPLVNRTRVRNGELPPVTLEGPPDEAGCVPRKLDGRCGSLWDALRYEKRVELIGVHPAGAYLDARGWQTLARDTPVHLPVPGRELATLQLDNYTFGGGGAGSAPAPEPEQCPVALPRCS